MKELIGKLSEIATKIHLDKVNAVLHTKQGMAVVMAVMMVASIGAGTIFFKTQPGIATIKTGSQSFEQQVFFNTTNAINSTENLQIGHTNVTNASKLFLVQTVSSNYGWSFSVNNLTQGEYVIMTVGIKNTGSGNLPFGNYSALHMSESGTGPFTQWKANSTMNLTWNNGSSEGSIAGWYPTPCIVPYLLNTDNGFFPGSNQTLFALPTGPQSGFGSGYPYGNANASIANKPIIDYPTVLAPGQEVYYNIIFGLGTYAPMTYLNQTYTFTFTIGAMP